MGCGGRFSTGILVLVCVALGLALSAESFRSQRLRSGCVRTTHLSEFEQNQRQAHESLGRHYDPEIETQALEYHHNLQGHHEHLDGGFKGYHLGILHQSDEHFDHTHQSYNLQKSKRPEGMSKFGWLHHFDLPEGVKEQEHSDRDDNERKFYHHDGMRRFQHEDGERKFYHHYGVRGFPVHDGTRFHRHHDMEHRGLTGMLLSTIRHYVRMARHFVSWWRYGGSLEWNRDRRFGEGFHAYAQHEHFGGKENGRHFHLDHDEYHSDHPNFHEGAFAKSHHDRFCGSRMGSEHQHRPWRPNGWRRAHHRDQHVGMRKFGWLHHSDMLEGGRPRELHEHFDRHDGERRFFHQGGERRYSHQDGESRFSRQDGERTFSYQDGERRFSHQDGEGRYFHHHGSMQFSHGDNARKFHIRDWMRRVDSNDRMRGFHRHHGMEQHGLIKTLFSKVLQYMRRVRNIVLAWKHGKPLDFSYHQHSDESFTATPWPLQFTVNFTTKNGEASGFLAYDWVHKRQIIYHGPKSTFCSGLGTEEDCQMMEVPSGTYIYIPSQNQCKKTVDNVGSVPPEWTTNSEYVGTDLVPGVGECRAFAFPPTEHVYYETVDGGLPCVFVFPDPSMSYYFLPETFKLGTPDEKFFDFPKDCVTISREIVLRKRVAKKVLPKAV